MVDRPVDTGVDLGRRRGCEPAIRTDPDVGDRRRFGRLFVVGIGLNPQQRLCADFARLARDSTTCGGPEPVHRGPASGRLPHGFVTVAGIRPDHAHTGGMALRRGDVHRCGGDFARCRRSTFSHAAKCPPDTSRGVSTTPVARQPPVRFELGTGVRTYVSSSAPYVVASMLLLSSDGFVAALVAGLGFGVGRATTPLARVISRDGVDWDARLAGRLPIITIGSVRCWRPWRRSGCSVCGARDVVGTGPGFVTTAPSASPDTATRFVPPTVSPFLFGRDYG